MQEFEIDMEEEFLNIGLDIIGLGVFNYDFGSITQESPVIKVVFAPHHCMLNAFPLPRIQVFVCLS